MARGKDLSRKAFLASFGAAAVGSFIPPSFATETPSFAEAKDKGELRNAYLATLLPQVKDFVTEIAHIPSPLDLFLIGRPKKKPLADYALPERYAAKMKGKIRAYDPLFEHCENEGELLSRVVDHEGWHARDCFYGIKLQDVSIDGENLSHYADRVSSDLSVGEAIHELRANHFQLAKMFDRGLALSRGAPSDFLDIFREEHDRIRDLLAVHTSNPPPGVAAQLEDIARCDIVKNKHYCSLVG